MAALKKTDERTIQLSITPEYDVYIFHPPSEHRHSHDWERKHTTSCIKQARRHAEELLQTNNYPKVEIQKKYFDARRECAASCTMKIYEKNPEVDQYKIIALAVVIVGTIIILTAFALF